jgi:penicillin-binding protein 1A
MMASPLNRSPGKVLYSNPRITPRKLLSDTVVRDALALLRASVDYGTSHIAALPNAQVFGKTGTSQNFRDAWFIGFTGDLVVGIWVGTDNNTPMKTVTGGTVPAKIFKNFMSRIE